MSRDLIVPGWLTLVLAASGGALTVWFFLEGRIESTIDAKLQDPRVLSEIASRVRPAVIFDLEERIEAETGARRFVDFAVEQVDSTAIMATVTITPLPGVTLPAAPILESIDRSLPITRERGPKGRWIYTVYHLQPYVVHGGDRFVDPESSRLRLEVLLFDPDPLD